jgi:hypothetical protein
MKYFEIYWNISTSYLGKAKFAIEEISNYSVKWQHWN